MILKRAHAAHYGRLLRSIQISIRTMQGNLKETQNAGLRSRFHDEGGESSQLR